MRRLDLKLVAFAVVLALLISVAVTTASSNTEEYTLPIVIELEQENIANLTVTDGDTFKFKTSNDSLPVDDDNYVTIRLAGVNCAEKRDQASWLSAKQFTEDFLGSNEYLYQIEYIGNGEKDRALAFVTRIQIQDDENTENEDVESDTQEDGDLFQEDLGQSLIKHGLAIPSIARFESESKYEPYKEKGIKYTQAAVDCYNSPPEGDTLWAEDNLEGNIDLILSPDNDDYSDNDTYYTKGNKITMSWTYDPKNDYLDLSGYSIMDENAPSNWSDHRFFLPDITLGMKSQEIRIWLHTPDHRVDHWMLRSNDGSYDLLALLTHNFITKESKGESIFLRDPNRQIVFWRYWNGKDTVEPHQILCQSTTIKMWVDKSEYIVDDKSHQLDVPPQIYDGSTFVPLRALGDALDCKTEWYGEEKKVNYSYYNPCKKTSTVLQLWIDERYGLNNDDNWDIGKAPMIVDGRTLVPLRAISEALGADVEWDGDTKQITIMHPIKDEE